MVLAFAVPPEFAASTVTRAGEAGRQWLARLPAQVEALYREWSLVMDGAPMHGGLSVVVPVRQGGLPCVLKVGWAGANRDQEDKVKTARETGPVTARSVTIR